jgi:hypothetical protein
LSWLSSEPLYKLETIASRLAGEGIYAKISSVKVITHTDYLDQARCFKAAASGGKQRGTLRNYLAGLLDRRSPTATQEPKVAAEDADRGLDRGGSASGSEIVTRALHVRQSGLGISTRLTGCGW